MLYSYDPLNHLIFSTYFVKVKHRKSQANKLNLLREETRKRCPKKPEAEVPAHHGYTHFLSLAGIISYGI